MFRFLSKLVFVVIVGGFGGVLFIEAVLPYLQHRGWVQNIALLQRLGADTNIIERTEKIIVEENSALEYAIAQSQQSAIAIRAVDAAGRPVAHTSGLVLTNDGIVIASSTVVKEASRNYLVRGSRDWFGAELWGIDIKTGLAIFHAANLNLSPAAFIDTGDIVLGKRIFALSLPALPAPNRIEGSLPALPAPNRIEGSSTNGSNLPAVSLSNLPRENTYHVEDGIITSVTSGGPQFDTSLRLLARLYDGAALFSLDNKVLGIARFVTENETKIVSFQDIEAFLRRTLAQRAAASASSPAASLPARGQ